MPSRLFLIIAFISGCIGFAPAAFAVDPPNPALTSEYIRELVTPPGEELDLDACESWNPEFVGNGMRCCKPCGEMENSPVGRLAATLIGIVRTIAAKSPKTRRNMSKP